MKVLASCLGLLLSMPPDFAQKGEKPNPARRSMGEHAGAQSRQARKSPQLRHFSGSTGTSQAFGVYGSFAQCGLATFGHTAGPHSQ
jgi:hypothetical protein